MGLGMSYGEGCKGSGCIGVASRCDWGGCIGLKRGYIVLRRGILVGEKYTYEDVVDWLEGSGCEYKGLGRGYVVIMTGSD